MSVLIWVKDHWVLVALVISELLPFLPNKINGITQAVLKLLSEIFKK